MTSKISELTAMTLANGEEWEETSQQQPTSPITWSSFRTRKTPVHILCVCSDEVSAINSSPVNYGKIYTVRAPFAFHLLDVRASLTTACSTGTFTVDINRNGSSLLSTVLTIDATQKTSETAATPAVIDTTASPRTDLIADDDEITIDVDNVGDGNATGLKVWLIGQRIG